MFMLVSEMISHRSLLAHVSIASGASSAQPRPSEDIYLVQGVTLFAIGLLDILKSEDSGNGRVRVTVALTADIRDLSKRLPTSVGSIAAVQKTAIGSNRIEATNASLILAATEGARDLLDQLRQRGIN